MDNIYTDIYEKLSTIQWLMKRRQMFSQAESGPFADSTRGQGRILAMLKIQPEITTKDLSYLLGIRQQSLNELLNKMEKCSYVERRPSEIDRRVMVVHLTEKGKQVHQPASDYHEILDCLSQEELQQFGNYLDRIILSFQTQEGVSGEETVMKDWMEKAKERMGEEQFEQLLSMRERAFGSFRWGKRPADIPGAERFSPDYDGPVPDRGEFGRFGSKERK
ncbi:MAG: MarR family transcriptional regulator [Lachnospiraceae bacterium]|nr:MarR family transcriptional regulator [Lachnospiraceae bacterium]